MPGGQAPGITGELGHRPESLLPVTRSSPQWPGRALESSPDLILPVQVVRSGPSSPAGGPSAAPLPLSSTTRCVGHALASAACSRAGLAVSVCPPGCRPNPLAVTLVARHCKQLALAQVLWWLLPTARLRQVLWWLLPTARLRQLRVWSRRSLASKWHFRPEYGICAL